MTSQYHSMIILFSHDVVFVGKSTIMNSSTAVTTQQQMLMKDGDFIVPQTPVSKS